MHARLNSSNAIAFLEYHLDHGILELGDMLAHSSQKEEHGSAVHVLIRIKEYRLKYPRMSEDPIQDEAVSNVLSHVNVRVRQPNFDKSVLAPGMPPELKKPGDNAQ